MNCFLFFIFLAWSCLTWLCTHVKIPGFTFVWGFKISQLWWRSVWLRAQAIKRMAAPDWSEQMLPILLIYWIQQLFNLRQHSVHFLVYNMLHTPIIISTENLFNEEQGNQCHSSGMQGGLWLSPCGQSSEHLTGVMGGTGDLLGQEVISAVTLRPVNVALLCALFFLKPSQTRV